MKKVFLDTETSGLAPGEIAQLSLIIEEETGEVRAKNYFFKIKSTKKPILILSRKYPIIKEISK